MERLVTAIEYCIQLPTSELNVRVSFAERQKLSSRTLLNFDADRRPRNPIGRTGLRGRGSLGSWGPNFAADLLVTRWVPGSNGIVEATSLADRMY